MSRVFLVITYCLKAEPSERWNEEKSIPLNYGDGENYCKYLDNKKNNSVVHEIKPGSALEKLIMNLKLEYFRYTIKVFPESWKSDKL